MILLLCFLCALSAYNTRAAPVPFPIGRDAVPLSAECSTTRRTLFGIIWSCLSTTILCAWTAVHPNVPPRSKWKARWNRLKLMFWMLVAPELVLAWAVRQLFAARRIRDKYNRKRPGLPDWMKWTVIHGYMVEMGGFSLVYREDKNKDPNEVEGMSKVLTFDELKRRLRDPKFEFPFVSAADITDRSKGDTLFKLIAILQTTWFILQCIARAQQGLSLTELELVTLALASLNGATFAIWWHKPLGVQEPIKVYLEMDRPKVEKKKQEDQEHRRLSYGDFISEGWKSVKTPTEIIDFFRNPCEYGPTFALIVLFIIIPIYVSYVVTFPFFVLFPLAIIFLLRIIETEPVRRHTDQERGLLAARIVAALQQLRYTSSSTVTELVETLWWKIFEGPGLLPFLFGWFILLPLLFILLFLFTIFLTPFLILLLLVSFIFTAVFGIVTTSSIRPGAHHVPSFYAPITKSDRWSRIVVFALFGLIFGGLHCIGWNFDFPTRSEQTIWRATSLTITFIPLIVAPIDFLLTARLHNRHINSCKIPERIALLILDLIMTVLLFVYVPTRLSLIAQALALLRHQPSSALMAIDWTKYVPHLFS